MCGRYATGKLTWEAYRDWLDLGAPSGELVPTWNLKPTQAAPIVRLGENGAREIALARWGLIPRFFRKSLKEWRASTFNARIETAATAASFRASWKDRRCLVPAIGWYEWTGLKGARVPYFFRIETNAPGLCFAGLWDRSYPDGEGLDSFTILTTEPNATAADYHDRMPVVLTEEGYGPWLRGESDAPQQVGAARLKVHRVAPLKGDGPELIEPDEG